MDFFNTALLREKIVINNQSGPQSGGKASSVIIKSNRVAFLLGEEPFVENVVIRAQNMHTTLRLAAILIKEHNNKGQLLARKVPLNWEAVWKSAVSEYDKRFDPDIWGTVYINGNPVFRTVASPFADVVEKCALLSLDNYYATMDITEEALEKVGRACEVDHQATVAATIKNKGSEVDCGIMYRAGGNNTVFSYHVSGGLNKNSRLEQAIGFTAAYLEMCALSYFIETTQNKVKSGEVAKVSPEVAQLRAAIAHKNFINRAVNDFEKAYKVVYKPQKPNFVS